MLVFWKSKYKRFFLFSYFQVPKCFTRDPGPFTWVIFLKFCPEIKFLAMALNWTVLIRPIGSTSLCFRKRHLQCSGMPQGLTGDGGRNSSLSNRSLWEETDHPWLGWVELWAFIWDVAPVQTRSISFLTNFSLPISLQPSGVKNPKLKNLVCITGYNPFIFIQSWKL